MTRKHARQLFDELAEFIKGEIPGFEIRYKNESWFQKLIGVLTWVFSRHYMTNYTTTMYPIVWFPSRAYIDERPWKATKVLAHEYVHLYDAKGRHRWWGFRYAGPQTWLAFGAAIGLTTVGILLGPPWWVYLFSLLAVAPWPAAFRRDAELRGYSMNMVCNVWRHGSVKRSTIDWIVDHFIRPDYFFMWPFRKDMTKRVVEAEGEITFGRIFKGHNGKPYADVIRVFDNSVRAAA